MAKEAQTREIPMPKGLIDECIKKGLADTPSGVITNAFKLLALIFQKN
jgi:hypothetical protein